MSTSYGTITITDTTDLGQLSVYLTANTVRQQIYDNNVNPPSFYPNWAASGGALIITPHIYFNGQSYSLSSSKINVSWSKIEGGITYPQAGSTFPITPVTTACPETAAGTSNKELQRPTNLTPNSSGVTYIATITFYPIDNDSTISLQGVATLDLTISNNGANGADADPAKFLQLIGDGSHFNYTWDDTPIGATSITLTVEKSSTVSGVHWKSDNVYIRVQNDQPKVSTNTALPYYTGTSLTISISSNQSNISNLAPNFDSNKCVKFQVIETDNSGVEVNNGLIDYFSIYKIKEAQPGQEVYASYLDNDEETVSEYNGQVDLTNATTTFFLTKGGVNDLVGGSGWQLNITDSNPEGVIDNNQKNIVYTTSNVSPAYFSYKNHIVVTALRSNTAWIEFTATKTENSKTYTQKKRFTLVKNAQLLSHALRLDSVAANRDISGNYTPSSIIVDALVRTGGGTNTYRTTGVIQAVIYYEDRTYSSTLSNTSDNYLTLNLADNANDSPISYITTSLRYNNNVVDTQKIVITANGENGQDGTSPWNFIISNQFDAISTDFDNKTSALFNIILPIEAAQGVTTKTIYYSGAVYPIISAPNLIVGNGSVTISPTYHLGYGNNSQVTTIGDPVDNVRYQIPINTDIGANGSITLTLIYGNEESLTQTYTYKAQPQALKPIRVLLEASPTDTFENQSGTIVITPLVFSGTTAIPVSSWITSPAADAPKWEVYADNGSTMTWINATTWSQNIQINNSTYAISVPGSVVDGYLGLRFTVKIAKGGITDSYTEYINLKDIDDPLQVTLHSTIGEQIINGQGRGVIYARTIRRGDNEDFDSIVPDNKLGVGTTAPPQNDLTFMPDKLGYCYIVNGATTPTGEIRYYQREQVTDSWPGWYRGQDASHPYQYTYTWNFRNSENESYDVTDTTNTPLALRYAMNNNTQFVLVNSDIINNKITAIVKVEL